MFKKLSFRKRVFLLLGLLSIASIAFIVSNLNPSTNGPLPTPTPPSQIVSENSQIAALQPEKYSFSPSLTSFPFPANLPVYKTSSSSQPFLSPLFKQLTTLYQLEPSASPDYYYSKDKSVILLFDSKNQYLSYSIDGTVKPSALLGDKPPKLKSAISAAENFLKQFSDYKDLQIQETQISYSIVKKVGSEPIHTTDPAQASLISIPFSQYINNYPYRYSSSISSPVVITVGQNNQIVDAYFSPQPLPSLLEPKNYRLLTSDQIISSLNAGLGTVVYAPLYYLPGNTTDLPPTTISQIQIEYRLDPNKNLVIPYYLLTGELFLKPQDKLPIQIQILLPAVKL